MIGSKPSVAVKSYPHFLWRSLDIATDGMPESSKPRSGIASRLQLAHDEPTGLIVAVVAAQSNDEGPCHAGSSQRTFTKCVEQLMHGS